MDSMKSSNAFFTKDYIAYANESVVSKTLVKNKNGNTTLFAFDKGQGLSEHTSPFDALASIIEGNCRITIDGESFDLTEGQMILMPANNSHALEGTEAFKMMLIMIKDTN